MLLVSCLHMDLVGAQTFRRVRSHTAEMGVNKKSIATMVETSGNGWAYLELHGQQDAVAERAVSQDIVLWVPLDPHLEGGSRSHASKVALVEVQSDRRVRLAS